MRMPMKELSVPVASLLMASTLAVASAFGGDNDGSPATGAIERLDARFDEIVAQSDPKKAAWFAFPVKSDGTLGDARVLADATRWTAKPRGTPDGLKVDRYGNLFATGPGGVSVISPDGVLLGRIHAERTAANCTFGGDGAVLYITATDCLYRIKTKTQADLGDACRYRGE